MKVLHYLSHFSLLSETFIYDEINSLEQAHPHANTILTAERHLETERPFPRVEVLPPTLTPAQRFHRQYLKHVRRIRIPRHQFALYSYLAKNLDAFDLIHVHFAWNALPLFQVLRSLGWAQRKPVLVQCHGTDVVSAPRLDPAYQTQLQKIARLDNVFFSAHSQFLKRKMLELGIPETKIHPVANCFNPAFSAQRKRRFFQRGDCLKLINTARFVECKGQIHLVRGFAKFVREVYANSTLTLVGAGETLEQVKAAAEAEGVADKIKFPGGVPHCDLPQLFSEHDLYLQPSIVDPKTFQEESFGVTLLEALAVGLPLIVTRTGGMPEIVGEDNAFARTVPDRDADAIFRALKEMFEDGSCFQDTSAYAQQRLAVFTQERQLQDLKLVYQKALKSCGQ